MLYLNLFLALTMALLATVYAIIFFHRRKELSPIRPPGRPTLLVEELECVKLEVYRQSFKDIIYEIHDNFGQQLSVLNIQLNTAEKKAQGSEKELLEEIRSNVKRLALDLRSLSKSFYAVVEDDFELPEAIGSEINRINKLRGLNIEFKVNGIPCEIEYQNSLFLFRIFQEGLANLCKYPLNKRIVAILSYLDVGLVLELIMENAQNPFEPDIINFQKIMNLNLGKTYTRCKLIGAKLNASEYWSRRGSMKITLPFNSKTPHI